MRFPFVLAASLETLIGVAFVVISLISGLMNYLNSRAKPNGPNRGGGARPVRPRSERIQSEIEQFMREQVRRQEGEAPRPARPQPDPSRRPAQKPLPQRRPAAPRGPSARPAAKKQAPPLPRPPIGDPPQAPPTMRPGQEMSQRKSIANERLGQGLRDHLKTAMVERVQSQSQAHLGSGVGADVSRHLGTFGGATPSPAAPIAAASASSLAAEVGTLEGMRRALIAQTILGRPLALRRSRVERLE